MDENRTRSDIIDPAMVRAGWSVGEGPNFSAQEEYVIDLPNGKHQYVDYCLVLEMGRSWLWLKWQGEEDDQRRRAGA